MSEQSILDQNKYLVLRDHYEGCFAQHGDTHLGMDWPNDADVKTRFRVMLDVIHTDVSDAKLLDIGCGTGHLLDFIRQDGTLNMTYSGLDISKPFIECAKSKYPEINFQQLDLLDYPPEAIMGVVDPADYVVMNGLFTEKQSMTQNEMDVFFTAILQRAFALCRKGIAFNVMSAHVDWVREDLYHMPYDRLAEILLPLFGRHHIIRSDYGLYEYTVYVYR